MARQTLAIAIMICACTVLSALKHAGASSPDLLASWMAGLNFARGDFHAIYPALTGVFEMRPPEAWVAELRSAGHQDAIYPFIYPPLWAWAVGLLTKVTDYASMVAVANVVNPLLLGVTLWLAARMACGRIGESVYVLTGLVLFASTTISLIALEQNQPQILVAFLTVLAIERTRAGAPILGGAALAVAAALKLYPAFLALFWLARGERHATAAFALVGGALGLLSIAVAGWPLHAEFLAHIRSISGTVLVTFFSHSIDPVIGDIFFSDALKQIPSLDLDSPRGWSVMAKPAAWTALNMVATLGALAGLFALARSQFGGDPLFWPFALTVLALLSPLSWGYHYIAAVAYMPAFLARLGAGPGLLVCIALLAPTSVFYVLSDLPILPFELYAGLLGTLAMVAYAGLLLQMIVGYHPSSLRRASAASALLSPDP